MRCQDDVLLGSLLLLLLLPSAAYAAADAGCPSRRRGRRDFGRDGGGLGARKCRARPDDDRGEVVSVGGEEGVELVGAGPGRKRERRVWRGKFGARRSKGVRVSLPPVVGEREEEEEEKEKRETRKLEGKRF